MSMKLFVCTIGMMILLCMAVQASIAYEDVSIKEILDGNSSYLGKSIVAEGTIAKECQGRGCWLLLVDGNSSIFVDLSPNRFTIPLNMTGSKAKVYGNVSALEEKKLLLGLDPGVPYIIGKKVELTGEFNSPLIATG